MADAPQAGRPLILVFDVNETLLDIETLTPVFEERFADRVQMRTWFDQLVMYSMTLTLSGYYVDFFRLGRSVLQMVAAANGVDVDEDDLEAVGAAMRTMPAHPDVAPGLERLRGDGHRLLTLTNSPHREGAPSPLDSAGLTTFFERQFTVDSIGLYKPSTLLYRRVTAELDVDIADCMMVAAHAWDTIGAQSAGMAAALITRPGNAALLAPGVPEPTIVTTDIENLARRLAGRTAR